jgi:hypothetical protein
LVTFIASMKIKGILPILSAFIVFFLVLEILFWKAQNVAEDKTFLYPKGTLTVTQIDVQALAKILMFDLVFANENNEIFKQIRQLKTSESNDFDLRKLNWNPFSMIEKLEISHADTVFTCYRYGSEHSYNEQTVYSAPFSRLDLGPYTYLVLSEKFQFTKSLVHQLRLNDNKIKPVRTYAPISGFDLDSNGKISKTWDIQLASNKWIYRTKKKNRQGYSLQPLQSGFHISMPFSGTIIDDLNDKLGVAKLKELSGLDFISFNYQSLDFMEDEDYSVVPRFQCLIHFKNQASFQSFSASLITWQQSLKGSDALRSMMRVQVIDADEILIYTTNEQPAIVQNADAPVVQGKISALLTLTGGGWKKGMLRNFPLFQKLFSLTKQVEVTSFTEQDQQVILIESKGKETIFSLIFASFF